MGLWFRGRSTRLALPVLLLLAGALPMACSGDDQQNPQETVVPSPDKTPYPEDPDLAKGDKNDSGKAAEPKPADSEAVGQLTDDPFKGEKPATDEQAVAPTPTEPPVEPDALAGAFEGGQPKYDAAPGEAPKVPGKGLASGHKGKKGKHAKPAVSAEAQTRYVNATMLNVRAKPSKKAAVVRRLLGGAQVQVQLRGKWAKIQDGQWVRAKYLSETPTAQVSQSDADGAWKQAHHKGKGKKGKGKKAAEAPPVAAPVDAPPVDVPPADAAPADPAPTDAAPPAQP